MGSTIVEILVNLVGIVLLVAFVLSYGETKIVNTRSTECNTGNKEKYMYSGIYIKSVFDVINQSDLTKFVHDLDEKKQSLQEMFSVMPQRATELSAGYDLSILNDEVIPAHSSKDISFGDSIVIENLMVVGVIVPRSSLARKKGLLLAGGPKYIYPNQEYECLTYRFINYTDADVELTAGTKIAQVVFLKYPSWLTHDGTDIDPECDFGACLPDPLDESFMSPLLDGNIESIDAWNNKGNDLPYIDQQETNVYWFQAPVDTILEPGKVTCIMTGLRCKMERNQVFLLQAEVNNPNVILANSIGVIDADYYDNVDNGGEIGVLLLNRGNVPVKINSGDTIASGALYFYERADGDVYGGKRTGGFGSTD